MKKRICIVADVPNWAFDRIAQQLKKDLSYKYDITIDYFDRRKEADCFFELVERVKENDLIHFLNRRMLLLMNTLVFKNKVEASGSSLEDYISVISNKFSTAVYDYMDIDEAGIKEQKVIFNDYTKAYYTATKKLFEIYNSIDMFKKPAMMVHDICDGEMFKPNNLERFLPENINNRPLVIGWVGNSTHSGEDKVDLKGLRTIIKPAIEELKELGYNIIEHYADRNERWRTSEEMQIYYSEIDICLCASLHEGTPRSVLESMYSGVPYVSTDVGIVREALGKQGCEYILGDRDNGKNDIQIKELLKEKIIHLYNNRHILKELSDENMKSIVDFDGGKTIKDFDEFFSLCLNS